MKHNCLNVVVQKVAANLEVLPIPERVDFLSRTARSAASESARLNGLELDDFPKTTKGEPLPCNQVYWSLTHKTAYAGGVASLTPAGIDLEFMRPIAMKIYDRVASNKEWQLAINAGLDSRRGFFMFWTAKEALLKRLGVQNGFYKGLSDCVVEEIGADNSMTILSCGRKFYRVRYFDFDGHLAAICADDDHVCWHLLNEEGGYVKNQYC